MQKKWGIFAVAVIGAFGVLILRVHAQVASDPQLFITWQAANSYAPPSYADKILPNSNSAITASLEVISNGQPVDMSNQTIYWYLDDGFIGGGVGAQQATFHPDSQAPAAMILRVEAPDYPGGLLINEITIPVVDPTAVIDAPYPQGNFSGTQPTLEALPYFFDAPSISPLSFSWTVNNQPVSSAQNPQSLQISLPQSTPSGFQLAVGLTVNDSLDSSNAQALTNLTYQPHP